jgi:hypothetical protein
MKMTVPHAINLILDYILYSEMGGNYDPDDSWAQCHELLAELKDKVLEEECHLELNSTHLLEKCSLSG